MFIGHFTIAYILIRLFPGIPPLVPLIGVGFPDLLWPVLILLGVEKASVNPDSPLQKYIKFTSYPYSHSLVVGTLIALAVGIVLALLVSPQAGAVFVVASASHWLLDSIMHINDLPVLGFGSDRKVGIGLWSYSRLAFAAEYIFYAVVTALVMPGSLVVPLLIVGAVFHLINANSFLGFTKRNPFKSAKTYAPLAIFGFVAFSLVVNFMLAGA